MPRARLSDAERAALIARYRDGATGRALAAAFGESISTVRYHTVNVVRPAEAAARLRTVQLALARQAPASLPVLLPTARGAPDADPGAPDTFTLVSPAQRARLRKQWRAGATVASLAASFGLSAAAVRALVTGLPRSPRGRQRVRTRAAAKVRAQRGYPKRHRGLSAVRITAVRGGGVELRISRELYRQLGTPERLDVARHLSRLLLRRGLRYSVVNRGGRGMPRITLGALMRAALRLPDPGQYPARYYAQRRPHLTVRLVADRSIDDHGDEEESGEGARGAV